MANYNNGHFIETAIQSVLNQTFSNFEIIIVDDVSTDDSRNVIEYMANDDHRIVPHFLQVNKGYGNALKVAADEAKGELLAILDPDDAFAPNTLERMLTFFNANPGYSLYYSQAYICDDNLTVLKINESIGPIPENETYQSLRNNTKNHISHVRVMPKATYERTSGFNPYFKKAIDKDIIYKLEEIAPTLFIDEPLYYYRHHSGSISLGDNAIKAQLWEFRAKSQAYERRKNMKIPSLSKLEIYEQTCLIYRDLAINSLRKKEYGSYLKYLIGMIQHSSSLMAAMRFSYYTVKKANNPNKF
jgi:glycosyltransferase involved in cell wall biosynthesis